MNYPGINKLPNNTNPSKSDSKLLVPISIKLLNFTVPRYHMYVDCMNIENVPDIDKKQLDRITNHALGAAGLHAEK